MLQPIVAMPGDGGANRQHVRLSRGSSNRQFQWAKAKRNHPTAIRPSDVVITFRDARLDLPYLPIVQTETAIQLLGARVVALAAALHRGGVWQKNLALGGFVQQRQDR
jgi:hypothetical protein